LDQAWPSEHNLCIALVPAQGTLIPQSTYSPQKAMSTTADCPELLGCRECVHRDRRSQWRPTLHHSKSQKQPDFSGPCSNFSTQPWALRLWRHWCASDQSTLLCAVRL